MGDLDKQKDILEAKKAGNMSYMQRVSKEAVIAKCLEDGDFYWRFREIVDKSTMQVLAVLPQISEQALLQEAWNSFEAGTYLYDPETEGSFLEWMQSITAWIGEHSDSKASDLAFLTSSIFPLCSANKIPVAGIIKNVSKARSAVPVLRRIYNAMVDGDLDDQNAVAKIKEVTKYVTDNQMTVKGFNAMLKEKGFQGSNIDFMDAFDWPTTDKGGMLLLSYQSPQERTRLIMRLGNLIAEDNLGFWTDKLENTGHYAVWAGRAVSLLVQNGFSKGIVEEWDGKNEPMIFVSTDTILTKRAMQILYSGGILATRTDDEKAVVVRWKGSDTSSLDVINSAEELF